MRLGVLPDATLQQIHRAYRLAAKRAHPDVGGSREDWARILEAYETLKDDRRRRIYDETGEVEPGAVDNHYAQLLMRLTVAMDEIAANSLRQGPPFTHVDWVGSLRASFRTKMQQGRQSITEQGKLAREWDAVAKRLTTPPGTLNVLRGLAEGKARDCTRRASEAEAEIRQYEEVIELIAAATCAPGEMPSVSALLQQGVRLGRFANAGERMW
jgi:curved DNA-binding protein CbpA